MIRNAQHQVYLGTKDRPLSFGSFFPKVTLLYSRLRAYFQAAPLPHSFAALSLIVSLLPTHKLAELGSAISGKQAVFNGLGLFFSLSVLLCSSADAHCRFREYRRFKQLFLRFGFRPRILRLSGGSRCQRDAMLQAARETGLERRVRAEFTKQGYRWYHLLPDQIVTNPLFFFHPRFLRSTFWPG